MIGNGKWGSNYKNTLLKSKSIKVSDLTPIIKSGYQTNKLNNLFYNLKTKYDGLIVATPSNKQYKILIEILKLNIPVIVEKPLCINKFELKNIMKYKNKNQIIYVNHYHLFSTSFKKFKKSFKQSQVKNIFIQDGNYGPFRKNLTPILDWAPHSIGVILNLFKSKIVKFHYSKKLIDKKNDIEILIIKFLFIFSNGQKAFIKVGNGFKKRKNKISIFLKNNERIIFENDLLYKNQKPFQKNEPMPMDNLLEEFYNSIVNKSCNNVSFNIAKKTNSFLFKRVI